MTAAAISPRRWSGPPPPPARGTPCCSLRPARASTSFVISRIGARRSGGWRGRPPVAETAKRPSRRREQVAPVEYHLLLLVTLGLVAFGLVMVYSASSGVAVLSNRDPLSALAKQAVYAAIGVVAMLVCARVPYRQLRYAGPPVMFGVIVLLVLVLVPGIGAEINNARRWILIGPISIQPSEFAKAAVLIFSAA